MGSHALMALAQVSGLSVSGKVLYLCHHLITSCSTSSGDGKSPWYISTGSCSWAWVTPLWHTTNGVSPMTLEHFIDSSEEKVISIHHYHHHLRVVLSLLSFLWRNPSLDSFHWCLSWANLVQVVPRCRLRSSLHLVFGLPRGLNHLCGTQDVALMVHLLSWSLATWPAHRCFDCLMWSMMSVTPVCCRIQVLCLWSRRVMPSIILSIFLCATASASIWAVVKVQVSLPYVITGSMYTHWTLFSWSACLLCGFSWCCLPCWRQPIPKWYVSWSLALGLHPLKLSFPGRRTFQPLLWLFHRLRLWPSQYDYLAWSWFYPGAYWGPTIYITIGL